MEKIKKLYYLIFYKIYCFFQAVALLTNDKQDEWNKWRTLLVIDVLQALLLVDILNWCTIIFKSTILLNFNPPKYVIVILVLVIAVFNGYFTLHNNKWKKYAKEFKSYSKAKNRLANWLVFLIVIGIMGSLIFSYYMLYQVHHEAFGKQ